LLRVYLTALTGTSTRTVAMVRCGPAGWHLSMESPPDTVALY